MVTAATALLFPTSRRSTATAVIVESVRALDFLVPFDWNIDKPSPPSAKCVAGKRVSEDARACI
jgi:hypothetical protein